MPWNIGSQCSLVIHTDVYTLPPEVHGTESYLIRMCYMDKGAFQPKCLLFSRCKVCEESASVYSN